MNYKELVNFSNKPGSFDACFAFSVHKCGSSLMHKMIKQICEKKAIPSIDIPKQIFNGGIFKWGNDPEIADLVTSGYLYYGFRELPEAFLDDKVNLKLKRSVLLVRDPRDALVSQYFSYGGAYISHALPKKNAEEFLSRKRQTAHLGIDEYVLRMAGDLKKKMSLYKDSLDFSNVLLRKYEDIFFDKRTFLKEIFDFFRFKVDQSIINQIADKNDIRPDKEQVGKHIRKGFPGDHRSKLRGDTIERLNETFRTVSTFFGYEFD